MSCEILLRALRDKRLTRTDLAILGALIRIEGPPPSRKEVAAAAGCAASSVPRAARKLETLGYVTRIIDARDHGKRAKPTGYRLSTDTYQNGYVSTPVRIDPDTPDVVVVPAKQPQNTATRIEPDTCQNPPYDNNSTPLELYPERPESVISSGPPMTVAQHHLNGSAKGMKAHELSSKLIEIIDSPWLNPRSQALAASCGVIRQWIDEGADFDSDIVPTVAEVCTRAGKTISTWKYFTGAVSDCVTTRIAMQELNERKASAHEQRSRATEPHIRRDKISLATAERERDRLRLEAEARDRAVNLGRVESVRVG